MYKLLLPLCSVLVLAGCFEDKQMVLDLTDKTDVWSFYNQGFPSDLRADENGKLDLSGFPQPLNAIVQGYTKVVERDNRGFAPDMPIYIRFDGDYDEGDFSISSDAMSFVNHSSAIQLLDVDANSPERGRRFPIHASFRYTFDEYRPDDLLQVRPAGVYLRENTTYALVVTRDISPKYSDDLIPNEVLNKLLHGISPRSVDADIPLATASKALAVFAPLRQQYLSEGKSINDIVAATVWTTGQPSATLKNIADSVSAWAVPSMDNELTLKKETPEYCVLESKWTVPGLQQGAFPYAVSGGDIAYDSNGAPIVQYQRQTPMVVTIPKTAMPAEGYAMLLYHHGTNGTVDQVWDRGYTTADGTLTLEGSPAQIAALRGWAASGMGGHFGSDHQDQMPVIDEILDFIPGISINIAAYNFVNIKSMRDSLLQQLAERTLYRRLLNNLRIDASLCPGADASASHDGKIFFNTAMQVVSGQSLGSFTAGAQAVTDPVPLQGYIASGAGAYDLKLIMHLAKLPNHQPMGNIIEPLFFATGVNDVVDDPFHPIWAISDLALAPANFAYGLSNWKREAGSSSSALDTLLVLGHFDDWVGLPSQKAIMRALQSDMAGAELNVSTAEQLLPTMGYYGGQQFNAPVTGNDEDGRSNLIVRYAEDGIKSGHHVAFQYKSPKHQIGCFLQDKAAGYTPTIIAGSEIDGGCASGQSAQTIAPTYISLKNKRSGLCLDAQGGSAANGTNIQSWSCNTSAAQLWRYDATTGQLRSKLDDNQCLEIPGVDNQVVNGANVQLWSCTEGHVDQTWDLDGDVIRNRVNTSQAIDAYGTGEQSNIGLWTYHGGDNQRWHMLF